MSHNLKSEPTVKTAGPLGLSALAWIVIGALIGTALLLALPNQAPMFALATVGAGIGLLGGMSAGRFSRKSPGKQ